MQLFEERMRAALRERWTDISSSFWLIPAVEVIAAIGLSFVTLWFDAAYSDWLSTSVGVLFGGTAEGARTLLSVVAGSSISVISVLFSITMIALQQGSTQYTPRVLRTFRRDRGNQVVLGTYIATFAYALLILRQVRSETEHLSGFTPSLSIFIAIVLALVDLALLVYFIDHTSRSLEVSSVIKAIRAELDESLEEHFQGASEGVEPLSFEAAVAATQERRKGLGNAIHASRDGYLQRVDYDALSRELTHETALLCVPVRAGDFLFDGAVLARLWMEGGEEAQRQKRIADAFVVLGARRPSDDPLFGMRQLADIALRALSPGTNDPTTAEDAIDALGAIMAFVAGREIPGPLVRTDNGACIVRSTRTFHDYMEECFAQIRRAARTQPHVLEHLVDLFGRLADRATSDERAAAIEYQIEEILEAVRTSDASESDRLQLLARGGAALDRVGASAARHRET